MVITSNITATEKFKAIKKKISRIFFPGLGTCTKAKAEFKENATPVFRLKRSVPFTVLNLINKELERLEDLRVISKIDDSELASLTVCIKKKNNKICICADFFNGACKIIIIHFFQRGLQNYNYPFFSTGLAKL